MKKYRFIIIPCLFIIAMFLSSQNAAAQSYQTSDVCNLYIEKLDDIYKVMSWSTNIVKAKLLDCEDFNGYTKVYHFEVKKDYTANTPPEIYMYDSYNENYISGHTYYLFLEGHDSDLYPHTIYTTVKKDLIADTATSKVNDCDGGEIQMYIVEVPSAIKKALSENLVGTKN